MKSRDTLQYYISPPSQRLRKQVSAAKNTFTTNRSEISKVHPANPKVFGTIRNGWLVEIHNKVTLLLFHPRSKKNNLF
jgi:hypothetical protein